MDKIVTPTFISFAEVAFGEHAQEETGGLPHERTADVLNEVCFRASEHSVLEREVMRFRKIGTGRV